MLLALVLAAGFVVPAAQAQGGAGFDFKSNQIVATDFNAWSATSRTTVAAGAATITLDSPFLPTILGWGQINPWFANNLILVDAENGAVDEEITITSSSCTTPTSCTITATFSNAHSGQYTLRSGTAGVNEAIKQALGMGGGLVYVPATFGGVTADITAAVGSTSVFVVDQRAGKNDTYGWSGSAYVALLSMTATTITPSASFTVPGLLGIASPAATLTAKTGTAPALLTGSNDSTPNFNVGHVAIGANTAPATTAGFKTRATTTAGPATTTIVTGDDLFEVSAYGADGTNYIKTASILFDSTGTVAATRVPSVIKFSTGTDAAPTVLTTALTIGADQKATFAAGIVGTTATLSSLTSGRVTFAGASGLLGDDSDLTFATDTLTATKMIGSTSVSTPSLFNTAGALALTTVTSGNITLAPAAAATAAVTTNTRFETAKGTTVVSGSCSSGDCTLPGDGNTFIVSGTTTVDGFATAGWQAGSVVYIQTTGNITFNSGGTVAGGFAAMALTGNLSMTDLDTLGLLYDGTSWVEISLIQR